MSGMSIKKERVERNFDREFIIIEKYGGTIPCEQDSALIYFVFQ